MKRFFASYKLLIVILGLVMGVQHFTVELQDVSKADPDDTTGFFGLLADRPLATVEPATFTPLADESRLDHATRLTRVVHEHTYHCYPTDFSLSWIETITSTLLSPVLPTKWSEGPVGDDLICGFCHQRAITLANHMRAQGFADAWAYGLSGHVVVRFSDGDQTFATDPDYGVSPFRFSDTADEMMTRVSAA